MNAPLRLCLKLKHWLKSLVDLTPNLYNKKYFEMHENALFLDMDSPKKCRTFYKYLFKKAFIGNLYFCDKQGDQRSSLVAHWLSIRLINLIAGNKMN